MTKANPNQEARDPRQAILDHVAKKGTRAALVKFAELYAPKKDRQLAATPAASVASYWVTFLLTVILPMLPSLLLQAAPKIMANQKFRTIARATRDTLTGILGAE